VVGFCEIFVEFFNSVSFDSLDMLIKCQVLAFYCVSVSYFFIIYSFISIYWNEFFVLELFSVMLLAAPYI